LRAGKGELLVTAAAAPSVWERAEAILRAMAATLVRIGDEPGKGQAMKTVNQLLCGVHIAAAAEALALAGRLGLDQRTALDALMAGAAESFMLGNRGPRAIEADEGRDPEVLSRLDIFVKDMGIVTEAAKRAGIAIPVAAAAEQLFILGNAQGRGADDDSTVIRVLNPRS
ncbi:MAG: NAD-binding protein, partial [Schaalia hyovaginalis]